MAANDIPALSTSNTFGHLLVATNALIKQANLLNSGTYVKEGGDIRVLDGAISLDKTSGVTLTVASDATFGGQISSKTIVNSGDLTVQGPNILFSNSSGTVTVRNNIVSSNIFANNITSNVQLNTQNVSVNGYFVATGTNINAGPTIASFSEKAAVNVANRVFISNSGNVEVQGTMFLSRTSGLALNVAGNSSFTNTVVINVNDSKDALRINQIGSGNALVVEDSTNPDASPFVIDSTGNVGIGITAPTSNLHVSGAANITSSLIVSGMNVTSTVSSAFGQANTARDQANTAYSQANAAFTQANTANTIAVSAFGQANTARDQANTARDQANTSFAQANAAFTQANTANTVSIAAFGQANTARDQANNAYTTANNAANTVRVSANGGSIQASAGLNFNNTANIIVRVGAGTAGNSNVTFDFPNSFQTLNVVSLFATSLSVTNPIIAPSESDSASYRLRVSQTTRGDGTFGVNQGGANGNAEIRFASSPAVWQITPNNLAGIYYTVLSSQNVSDSVTTTSSSNVASLTAVKTAFDQGTSAYSTANTAANTTAVYANTSLVLSKAPINFNNSSTIRVTASPSGVNYTNVSFSIIGGAGSGIDADLLDGINSTSFVRTDAVSSGNIHLNQFAPSIRLESNDVDVFFGQEIGSILFATTDASVGGTGDKGKISAEAEGASGGAALNFFSAVDGGSAAIGASLRGNNDLRLYSSGSSNYHAIRSQASSTSSLTIPNGDIVLKTGTAANVTEVSSAANSVRVSANTAATQSAVQLNFNNTSTTTVSVTPGTSGNANVSFVVNTGTSGSAIPLLSGVNTWGAQQYFSASPVMLATTSTEGGELLLQKPSSSTLAGDIYFDSYVNTLRIFEGGGSFRGLAIDFTTLPAGQHTIWSAGNDGSGSGLDADLLDGQHASAFMYANATTFSSDSTNVANVAQRVETGFYQYALANTALGWPLNDNAWQHLLAVTHTNDTNYYSMQLAGSFYGPDLYQRMTNGNGFTAWNKIWTSGNDGPGSGLDADTLDGYQISSFLTTYGTASTTTDFGLGAYVGFNTYFDGVDSRWEAKTTQDGAYAFRNAGNGVGFQLLVQDAPVTAGGLVTFNNYYFRDGDIFSESNKVWHEGNDGAGSTLDADTVDSLQASQFLRSDTATTWSGSAGGVFQVSLPAGAYGNNLTQVNTLQLYQPTSQRDSFLTFHVAGDYAANFGIDGTSNDLFYGGWSVGDIKHKVWHAGNDGPGSLLDADSVDTYHVGTSGSAIPLLSAINTWGANQVFNGIVANDMKITTGSAFGLNVSTTRTTSRIRFTASQGSFDDSKWEIIAGSGQFSFRTYSNLENTSSLPFTITQDGNTIVGTTITNSSTSTEAALRINGNSGLGMNVVTGTAHFNNVTSIFSSDAADALKVVQTNATTGNLISAIRGSNGFVVDNDGRVKICATGTGSSLVDATATPRAVFTQTGYGTPQTPAVWVSSTQPGGASILLSTYESAIGVNKAALSIHRSRGFSNGTFGAILRNDVIGAIDFTGDTGSSINCAASIVGICEGTGAGYVSGSLEFRTSENTRTPPVRMQIANTGNVGISNTSPQHTLSVAGTSFVSGAAFFTGTVVDRPVTTIAASASYAENAAGRTIVVNSASPVTLTFNSAAYAGFTIDIIRKGTGNVTIANTTSIAKLNVASVQPVSNISSQYATVRVTYTATNEFILTGSIQP